MSAYQDYQKEKMADKNRRRKPSEFTWTEARNYRNIKFPTLYFAFGANLNFEGMNYRCRDYSLVGQAVLPNYRLTFKGCADVIEEEGSEVWGALYMISPEDLAALDRFEGYPNFYRRKFVPVKLLEDGVNDEVEVQALIYYMNGDHPEAPPYESYLQTILEGCDDWVLPDSWKFEVKRIARSLNPIMEEPEKDDFTEGEYH